MMSTLCRAEGKLHSRNTSTDYSNTLRILSLMKSVFLLIMSQWIQCTESSRTNNRTCVLSFFFPKANRHATEMAGNAGDHIFFSVFTYLCQKLLIAEELPANRHKVDFIISDCLCRIFQLHPARANYGLICVGPDLSHFRQITIQWHVYRRMRIVPGVIGTIVSIEGIISCFRQNSQRLFSLFKGSAQLSRLFICRDNSFPESSYFRLHRVAQGDREVLTAFFLNGFYHFTCKTQSVFKRTAILIRSVVCPAHGELIHQIAFMKSVNIHAVNSVLLTHICRISKPLDYSLDVLHRHFLGFVIFNPPVWQPCI